MCRWWRTARDKAEDFAKDRSPQSDEDFLAACNLPDNEQARAIALAVRRIVAEMGCIEPGFIRAEDRFPQELCQLTTWDSPDLLDVVFRLEKGLGVKVPRGGLFREEVPDPRLAENGGMFSVRTLAAAVIDLIWMQRGDLEIPKRGLRQ